MAEVLKKQAGAPASKKIGEFEILGKIDQGGLAEIFLGRQKSLDRLVAIKILSPDHSVNPEIVNRFEIESKTIARLRHPHIVHVIDRGIEDDRYYFVMEMIEGSNFKKMLHDKSTPLTRKFTVIIQVLKALDYAHKNGVIHRDIKPANILIDKSGNALVVDFGIAQIVNKDENDRTRPNIVMGTFNYMSPEQKVASANVDQTTDIYAVGIIMYEILTGKKPEGRFKNPSSFNSEVTGEMDRIVMKCLEQNKKDRYQSAARLKDDLLSALCKFASKVNGNGQKILSGELSDYVGRLSFLDTLKKTRNTATHLVEDRSDGSIYVLKTLLQSEAGMREARILKTLNNPGFIKVFAAGGNKEKSIILMAYARGGSLEDRLLRVFSPRTALQIFREIAVILGNAHKNNLVHGNLRPANILFDESDNIIITDFGQSANHRHQKNLWYSAPERKKVRQSDIYSAGLILHRILTNQMPIFDSYLRLIWHDTYPKIPISLKMLLMQMLRNGLRDRPQTFEDVIARIDEADRELASSKDDTALLDTTGLKRLGFRPGVLLLLVMIALIALGLLVFGETFFEPFFGLTS